MFFLFPLVTSSGRNVLLGASSNIHNPFGFDSLVACDAVWSGRNSQTFRRNVLPPSSGLKSKPSKGSTSVILLVSVCMRGYIFCLCSSIRVRDQFPHPHKAIRILYLGNYKTRNNGCNVGYIKQEVTKMASSGIKQYERSQYNGTW
jgi:hypothetical protein